VVLAAQVIHRETAGEGLHVARRGLGWRVRLAGFLL
jgi:hypothetical protein